STRASRASLCSLQSIDRFVERVPEVLEIGPWRRTIILNLFCCPFKDFSIWSEGLLTIRFEGQKKHGAMKLSQQSCTVALSEDRIVPPQIGQHPAKLAASLRRSGNSDSAQSFERGIG